MNPFDTTVFSRGAADVQLKAAETGALMGTVIGGPMDGWTGCGERLEKSSHIAANIGTLQDDAGGQQKSFSSALKAQSHGRLGEKYLADGSNLLQNIVAMTAR